MMPTISQKCKDLRLSLSLSQLELAEMIGSTQRNISHYEMADKPIPVDVVAQYANLAGQSFQEFVSDVDFSVDQISDDEIVNEVTDRVVESLKPTIVDIVKRELHNRR